MTTYYKAWDSRTGAALPQPVPAEWFDLFPYLTDKEPANAKPPVVPVAVDPASIPSEEWTVKDLRTYAEDHGIDLAGATTKADILAAVNPTEG